MKNDPSAAEVRTTMAWQRTSLALGVLALFAIKLATINNRPIGVIASIFALVGAAALYLFGRIRFTNKQEPLLPLVLSGITVALLAIATIMQTI